MFLAQQFVLDEQLNLERLTWAIPSNTDCLVIKFMGLYWQAKLGTEVPKVRMSKHDSNPKYLNHKSYITQHM